MSANKLEQLRAVLRACGSCLVAYSGGVDSVFLARVAHEVLGDRALAVIADSPSLPRRELQEALALAEQFRFPVRVVQTAEMPRFLNDGVTGEAADALKKSVARTSRSICRAAGVFGKVLENK